MLCEYFARFYFHPPMLCFFGFFGKPKLERESIAKGKKRSPERTHVTSDQPIKTNTTPHRPNRTPKGDMSKKRRQKNKPTKANDNTRSEATRKPTTYQCLLYPFVVFFQNCYIEYFAPFFYLSFQLFTFLSVSRPLILPSLLYSIVFIFMERNKLLLGLLI